MSQLLRSLPPFTADVRTTVSPQFPVRLKTGPSRTKQSFKDECDINQIMARYLMTGTIDFANKHQAQYADVSGIDFDSCMTQIKQAQAMFADLPAQLRDRFANDPARFLEYVADPDNRPEMQKLGLLITPQPDSSLVGNDFRNPGSE